MHGDLICSFSNKRYRKDKRTLEAQVERAQALVKKNETGKRAKFVKKIKANTVAFDEALKDKAELLLGIKGYCTNIPKRELRNKSIIAAYHDLWHVEASFRMSKNDLETRPIFHYKEDAVRAHVLLCFVALILGKYLEITTKLSLQKIHDLLWEVTETHIKDTLTNETFVFRSPTEQVMASSLGKLIWKWKIPH
jgi:transposase